jgi:cytochrome c-type biogenesis protein CcmH/NrfF
MIYLLLLWMVPLVAFLSAGVIVATDKRVRHSQGHSISEGGPIAVIGEQTNP